MRGGMMPLRRPLRMSWKMKGSQSTGMSEMYITAGRATMMFFEIILISDDAK